MSEEVPEVTAVPGGIQDEGTVKVVQPDPIQDLTEDAKNRAVRTFLVNLAVDVVLAVIVLLAPIVSGWQSFEDVRWQVLIFSVVKTVVLTVFSFVMRRYLDKSFVPTPKPPVISGDLVQPSLTGNK